MSMVEGIVSCSELFHTGMERSESPIGSRAHETAREIEEKTRTQYPRGGESSRSRILNLFSHSMEEPGSTHEEPGQPGGMGWC